MSEVLWTSAEAEEATSGTAKGTWGASGIGIDSRTLGVGDLFVALTDRRDGHDFIPEARKRCAAAVVSSRSDTGPPALAVADTTAALTALASYARDRASCHCTVITGSVGKTSVKEMCARIFGSQGRAHWSRRSFNNHWGVPLSLAAMPRRTRHAVFEIGMNAPGEIAPLTELARPDCAVITGIARAHLQGLGDIDAVAREKASIFAGLTSEGVAVIPASDRFGEYLAAQAGRYAPGAKVHSFGWGGDVSAGVVEVAREGWATVCTVEVLGQTTTVRLSAIGDHWALNAALALLIGRLAGVSLSDGVSALEGFEPPSGRGRVDDIALPEGGRICLFDDSYNANPASMRAGLSALAGCSGRKLAVLGVMEELGSESRSLHEGLAEPLAGAGVCCVFLLGERLRVLVDPLSDMGIRTMVATDCEVIVRSVMDSLRDGDTVFVKGSNASGAADVVRALRNGLFSSESGGVSV